jgi:PKD domain-containing protein
MTSRWTKVPCWSVCLLLATATASVPAPAWAASRPAKAASPVGLALPQRPHAGTRATFKIRVHLPHGVKLRSYELRFGDGHRVAGRRRRPPTRVTHVYRLAGRYRVTLVVRGGHHAWRVRRRVTVKPRAAHQLFAAGVPVVCVPVGDGVTLSAYRDGRAQQFATVGPGDLAGWDAHPVTCDERLDWSADFSMYAFAGTPPGADDSVVHIGVLNLATHAVSDVTAPRQQGGFSAPTLSENAVQFLGAGDGRVSFGSTSLFVHSSAGYTDDHYLVVPVGDPARATEVTPSTAYPVQPTISRVAGGHFEQQIDSGVKPGVLSNGPLASPDGKLIAWYPGLGQQGVDPFDLGAELDVWQPGHGDALKPVKCPTPDGYAGALGWRDATHLLVALRGSDDLFTGGWDSIGLVTLGPDGSTQGCRLVLPPTSKDVTQPYLSLDGQRMFFTTPGPTGPQSWVVSLAGDSASAPQQTSSPETYPSGAVVFYPVT